MFHVLFQIFGKKDKMKRIIFTLFLIIVISDLFSQNFSDSVLVDMGSKSITIGEFVKRFELTPWPSRNFSTNSAEAKSDFLISLIAEKLMSINAEEINIDTVFILKNSLQNLEKMLVRDALYKKEISDKVSATKKEIDFAIQRSLFVYYIRFVESRDSLEISRLYNLFKKGISFDSILVERNEYKLQIDPVGISFGTMPPELEDLIYSTKIKNYSKPIFSDGKFYVFKVDSILNLAERKDLKLPVLFNQAEKKLKERKEKNEYRKYFSEFFADKKGKIEEINFIKLVETLHNVIKEKVLFTDSLKKSEQIFNYNDLDKVENNLWSILDKPLFYADTSSITIRDFLHRLVSSEFKIKDTSLINLSVRLQAQIRSYIADEFLTNEGYKQGLQNKKEVKEDLKLWRDSYFANAYSLLVRSKINISNKEIDSFYIDKTAKINSVDIYKVQEILVDSLEQIEKILQQISTDIDFGSLAKKYSIRKWAAENNGELGYITEGMFGPIGVIVPTLKIGEVYAPVKVDSGYSIIKLTDKKKRSPLENSTIAEQKEKIREILFQNKFNTERDRIVSELAIKNIKSINFNLMKSVQTTDINLMVFRYYGFGGKTTGVPMLRRYNSWFDIFQELKKQNP